MRFYDITMADINFDKLIVFVFAKIYLDGRGY